MRCYGNVTLGKLSSSSLGTEKPACFVDDVSVRGEANRTLPTVESSCRLPTCEPAAAHNWWVDMD